MATYRDFYTKTTNMIAYQNPNILEKRNVKIEPTAEDPYLINGKFNNNLKIRKDKPSQHFNPDSEEYLEFIKRADKLSKVLHEKYFKDKQINGDHMEKVYNQLLKSCYLFDYGPNATDITSKKSLAYDRSHIDDNQRIQIKEKYPFTTFLTSYRNFTEIMDEMGLHLNRVESFEPNKTIVPLKKAFQEIFKFGKTTYQMEICALSERNRIKLLKQNKILPGPIDCYTKL